MCPLVLPSHFRLHNRPAFCCCPPFCFQIEWARLEREQLYSEGSTWQRVLHSKQSEAGLLLLRLEQAKQEADAAEQRSLQV